MNPLSLTSLSINSLHSHQHISSLQCCLLLQTLASSLHLHLHVSRHSMCLVSLVLDIRLNTSTFKFFYNIRNTQFWIGIIDIVTTTTTFTCFNPQRKKHRFITINTNNLWSLHSWLFIEIQLNKFTIHTCETW